MREHLAKHKIIELLAQGEFISGEEIGGQLNISRAAVSKHIKGLIDWGLDVFSVQGRGYKLATPLQLLDLRYLQQKISSPVELISVIDSTNEHLLNNVEQLESGSVCLAEYQTQGRGRRGRQWISPFGSNLYLSMYWKLDAGMAAAMGLSLVVGVAIVEALEKMGINGVKLKWPNDLYYQDKKLAGILVEMSGQAGGAAHLVIGMGLNVSMSKKISGIDQPWVSLMEVAESLPERNDMAVGLIKAWQAALTDYESNGMRGFVERWNRLDNFIGRPAKLLLGKREISGIVQGINEQGALLLETEQGVESFIGGEISLRAQ